MFCIGIVVYWTKIARPASLSQSVIRIQALKKDTRFKTVNKLLFVALCLILLSVKSVNVI